jgi:uncharacterized protein (DUF2344 family)
MKYLLLFIFITLYSCDNTDFKSKNPQQDTTIELQKLAQQDTVTYKVIELEDKYYCINTQTNMVEYKIINATGTTYTLLLIMAIVFVIFLIATAFID